MGFGLFRERRKDEEDPEINVGDINASLVALGIRLFRDEETKGRRMSGINQLYRRIIALWWHDLFRTIKRKGRE